jgi:hypothetical protein
MSAIEEYTFEFWGEANRLSPEWRYLRVSQDVISERIEERETVQ